MRKTFKYLIALFFLGMLITVYVREIANKDTTFATGDEISYTRYTLLSVVESKEYWLITGVGYAILGKYFENLIQTSALIGISKTAVIFSVIYPVLFFIIYVILTRKWFLSFFSSVIILALTFFSWAMVEGKAQQVGLVLFAITTVFFYKRVLQEGKLNISSAIVLFILIGGTLLMHWLSFMLLSFTLIFLLIYHIITRKGDFKRGILIYLYSVIALYFIYYLNPKSIYHSLSLGIIQVLTGRLTEKIDLASFGIILSIHLFILVILFLSTVYIANNKEKFRNFIKSKIKKVFIINNKYILFIAFILIVSLLLLQLKIPYTRDFNSYYYRGSMFLFLFFQIGNIFFALGYLMAIKHYKQLKEPEEIMCLSMSTFLLIGGILVSLALISLSQLFPSVMIFGNSLLRIVVYWGTFAAIPVGSLLFKKFAFLSPKKVIYAMGFILLLIAISVINASHEPNVFNARILYWRDYEVKSAEWISNKSINFCYNSNPEMLHESVLFGIIADNSWTPPPFEEEKRANKFYSSGDLAFYTNC